jgi:hypothetical protein
MKLLLKKREKKENVNDILPSVNLDASEEAAVINAVDNNAVQM